MRRPTASLGKRAQPTLFESDRDGRALRSAEQVTVESALQADPHQKPMPAVFAPS
jgi:hypothetical protein